MKSRVSFRCGVLLVGIALWGCCRGPRTLDDPVRVPDLFSEEGVQPLEARWWTSFGDPALDKAMELAFRDSFTLAAAWDRLGQAEALARRQGAVRSPALDGNASASRTRERRSGETAYTSSLLAELAVSYELDLWGRLRAAHEAARLDVEATEQDVQSAALTLSASLATVWYEIGE